MAKRYKVKLLRKEKLTRDTWLFVFEKPFNYTFTPGQFHTVFLTLPNGKEDSRDMTITSSPHIDELWLVTKILKSHSEFKEILLHMSIGDSLMVQGPMGGFTLRDKKRPHVFIAGGIGVNVFHSILKEAEKDDLITSLVLFVSFSKKQDMIFYKELKESENAKRKIIYTLTKEDWEGEQGRISEKMITKYVKNIYEPIFMIAGGQDFVDTMNELLLTMKVPEDHIRIDYFTGY